VNATRAMVYRALMDARAVAIWIVPSGMTSHVHNFDAREGGEFRISLTYDAPTGTGKTTAQTDTFHGRFVKPVENELVVEVIEFETTDPALRGEMTITYTLTDADAGTNLLGVHDGLRSTRPSDQTALRTRQSPVRCLAYLLPFRNTRNSCWKSTHRMKPCIPGRTSSFTSPPLSSACSSRSASNRPSSTSTIGTRLRNWRRTDSRRLRKQPANRHSEFQAIILAREIKKKGPA
jgi:uncharacterized protein YndB with AHSA1/START domain